MSQTIDAPVVPTHLGIIPDGNRRWAKAQGLPTLEGHRRGVDTLKEISQAALDAGVSSVTCFAFSTENWRRASDEVKYLMELFYRIATKDIKELHEKGIRFRIVGSREGLNPRLLKAFDAATELTANNTGGTVALALNYGGEQELADAAASLIREGVKPEGVTVAALKQHLYASDMEPLDLVIRTSGEHRTSGFMLMQAAYAELYFSEKNWPDFTPDDLRLALADYAGRVRRFGA